MTRTLPILAASVTAVSLLWSVNANAQLQREMSPLQEASSITVIEPGPAETPRALEGNVADIGVVDLKPPGEIVTVLRLDNNTNLIVPESKKAPGADVKVGAHVLADYVDRGAQKIATFLRVPEVQAP